jgi:hypothetical protein
MTSPRSVSYLIEMIFWQNFVYIIKIIRKSYFLFERKKYKFRCINSTHSYAIMKTCYNKQLCSM